MPGQKRHAQNGVLVNLAYYKYFLQLHVSNTDRYLHYSIERESSAVCHLSMGVTLHSLFLNMLG